MTATSAPQLVIESMQVVLDVNVFNIDVNAENEKTCDA
jgi:hypothetical protein